MTMYRGNLERISCLILLGALTIGTCAADIHGSSQSAITWSSSSNRKRGSYGNHNTMGMVGLMQAKRKLTKKERQEVEEIQRQIAEAAARQEKILRGASLPSDEDVEVDYGDNESLKALKQSMGPFARLVASTVEVSLATAEAFLSGGTMGFIGGGLFSLPSIFKELPPEELAKIVANHKGKQGLVTKLKYVNHKAFSAGKNWGTISASFTGFNVLVRVCRGDTEDRWNNIIGSACAGAFMSRASGPEAMLRSASTFAGITYLLDVIGGGGGSQKTVRGPPEFDFTDYELEESRVAR